MLLVLCNLFVLINLCDLSLVFISKTASLTFSNWSQLRIFSLDSILVLEVE